MSQRSKKEMILNLYFKKYPNVLERILDVDLTQIELEIPHGRKKIDFYAVSKNKRVEVFVENQLTPSDEAHLNEKIMPILQGLQEGIVVWTAQRFDTEHLSDVKGFLKANPQKYVNFYGVELHPEVIKQIGILDGLDPFDIWPNLWRINKVTEPLKLVYRHDQMPDTHIGKAYVGKYRYDFNRIEDVKKCLMEYLRKHLAYFPNVHTSKKHLAHSLTISLGAGISGVVYQISTRNRKGRAFVGIHFDEGREDIYRRFCLHMSLMTKKVHPNIVMENRSLRVYFEPYADLFNTMAKIKTILEKMIQFFSPYLLRSAEGLPEDLLSDVEEEKSSQGLQGKVVEQIMQIDKEWLRSSMIDPRLAEILWEEVTDERSFFAKQERLSEYLIHRF
ncbi:hypothetical protein ABEV55_05780 [Aneurinibacillus thermoaerophilus]|uniref:hypothetical protein n=1 Tax=Aneurinibacillus thermoaerophilus TaxID=143495 RepID=UPI002E1A7122|nr:hypothetical protein [Aneurinibacillus thermoaerophilus]